MNALENLTIEEKNAIEELKQRTVKDCTPKMLKDPFLFYRFMKARDFNLKHAESMIRKHIVWRKEFGTDTLITDYDPPEVLKKYAPLNPIGFDKEGSPILYVSISGADNIGLVKSVKQNDMLKFWFQAHERDMDRLKQQSQKLGKPIRDVVYIYDLKNLTFAKATHKPSIDMMVKAIPMYQDNYPERVKSVYVINTSFYFNILYNMLKMFLTPGLVSKVHFFGSDGWKEALLDIIDAEVLPAFLGGNRRDPDGNPLCNSFICHGGLIPKHYYFDKSKKKLHLAEGVQKLNITPFSSAKLNFNIIKPNSLLEWEFETKNNDIGFGVYFEDNLCTESKPLELVPKQRIDTSIEPEIGVYKCEKPGLYIIIFDNSYSWIRRKEVYYKVTIVPPSNEEDEWNFV